MMIIRRANDKDVESLSELAQETYTEAFGHSFLPSDLVAHLEHNLSPGNFAGILARDSVLIAEAEERIVGFVQIGGADTFAEADSDRDRAIRKMYVHVGFQNRGVGKALMEAALEQLCQDEVDRVFLDVWEHNLDAQGFYKRYGFEVIGERRFEVASGAETSLDLVMMRDCLGNPRLSMGED